MTNFIRITAFCLLLLIHLPAYAEGLEGEWLVKDKTAHMRTLFCEGKLWGIVSWVTQPGVDEHNPDPSKRARPIIGLPIILGMQAAQEGKWKGDIYNADNGKIYHGSVWSEAADKLHIEGCVLGGLFCGGEDWTRLTAPAHQKASAQLCQQIHTR